jgi:hypothetical protein
VVVQALSAKPRTSIAASTIKILRIAFLLSPREIDQKNLLAYTLCRVPS